MNRIPAKLSGRAASSNEEIEGTKALQSSAAVNKKTKFIPVSDDKGQFTERAKLPGSHQCHCAATRHKLINNCLTCGRIVCEQEGSGPCFFCGSLVCTPAEQDILKEGTKRSRDLHYKLMGKETESNTNGTKNLDPIAKSMSLLAVSQTLGQQEAIEKKNKLLLYDRTSNQRRTVIDDQSDYFSHLGNAWLTDEERAAATAKAEALRQLRFKPRSQLSVRYTLDFAGRQIIAEDPCAGISSTIPDVSSGDEKKSSGALQRSATGALDLEEYRRILGVDRENPLANFPAIASSAPDSSTRLQPVGVPRLQDESLDLGGDKCLSVRQPFASLLVAGIKTCEGRSWYTPHRGLLWIASAAHVPSEDEIKTARNFYNSYTGGNIDFPDSFPCGCLLGCVTLLDCVPYEDCSENCSVEVEAPYIFFCAEAKPLRSVIPIKGQHKIYQLESKILETAKKLLRV